MTGSFVVDFGASTNLEEYIGRYRINWPSKEDEIKALSFLHSAFTYIPELRPTARQLMQHEWLVTS